MVPGSPADDAMTGIDLREPTPDALPELLRGHIHAFEAAFESGEWFASAVWASVALEAALEQLFIALRL